MAAPTGTCRILTLAVPAAGHSARRSRRSASSAPMPIIPVDVRHGSRASTTLLNLGRVRRGRAAHRAAGEFG